MNDASEPRPVESYVNEILVANPTLPARVGATVRGLANLYRLLDYHEAILAANPGSGSSAAEYIKLRTLAIRHEHALGIVAKLGIDEAPDPLTDARRPQRAAREFGKRPDGSEIV